VVSSAQDTKRCEQYGSVRTALVNKKSIDNLPVHTARLALLSLGVSTILDFPFTKTVSEACSWRGLSKDLQRFVLQNRKSRLVPFYFRKANKGVKHQYRHVRKAARQTGCSRHNYDITYIPSNFKMVLSSLISKRHTEIVDIRQIPTHMRE
jgi:hypothetical protein